MRSRWTVFTNNGHRLLLCLPPLLIFGPFAPDDALGKGGTNFHESLPRSAFPTYQPTSPSDGFGRYGPKRYRDPRTHKCRGPADFGN